MPTPTYDLIASTTLAASASEVSFGSLPQTYRDLIVVSSIIGTGGTTFNCTRVNGLSTSIYSRVTMAGPVGAFTSSGPEIDTVELNSSTISTEIVQFMDYSATDKHKTVLYRTNDRSAAAVSAVAGRVATTAAITSISFRPYANSYASGSTFQIYGVIS
jgi:hypothetical protein